MANANTDGYSRQRVRLSSVGSATSPAMFATGSPTGGGVKVTDIERHHRPVPRAAGAAGPRQRRAASSRPSRSSAASSWPSPSPERTVCRPRWPTSGRRGTTWPTLPDDLAARTQLLENAQTVVAGFHTVASEPRLVQADGPRPSRQRRAAGQQPGGTDRPAEPGHPERGERRPSAQRPARPARPALAAADLARRRHHPGRTQRHGRRLRRRHGPRRANQSLTMHLDSSGPVAFRWDTDNTAAQVTSGQDGGLLHAINVDIPKYRTVWTTWPRCSATR